MIGNESAMIGDIKIIIPHKKNSTWKKLKSMKLLYLMLLFPVVFHIVFHYIPIYGLIIAFKDFKFGYGILGSPWNGFEHFKTIFSDYLFIRCFKNTLIISIVKTILGFPAPIVFALLLNELKDMKFKKVVQSVSYLPHFMSWVILAGMMVEILSPQRGIVNYILSLFGVEAVNFLSNKNTFVPMLVVTDIWQSVGWGAVIYLATLSSIDPSLYEAAEIDGAGRLQRNIYITLPSLLPVITILFILHLGKILNAGFDQILNLYNPMVYEVADIIDTFVYRKGLVEMQYDYAAAVGLFKNVVGVVLILGTNTITRKFSEYGIW